MNKTRIEWCDYTINPVKGLCPMACSYCYARAMYKWFKWNPELRFDPTVFNNLPTKPARVFVGSTMELFLPQCEAWLEKTLDLIKPYKWLTFQFLTKQPQNLIKWSPFPDNTWVGVSATDDKMFTEAIVHLQQIKASVKYISFEPLLGEIGIYHYLPLMLKDTVQWIIIGQQTPVKLATMPKIGWVQEIVEACDKAGIPVFLKDNLFSCVDQYDFAIKYGKYRQELPGNGDI